MLGVLTTDGTCVKLCQMRLFNVELTLKKATPIGGVRHRVATCEGRLDLVEAALDEVRKMAQATQRKVYRDAPDTPGLIPDRKEPEATPAGWEYQAGRIRRTGEPA